MAADHIDEGRFTRAIGPQQAENFTLVNLQADLVQRLNAGESFGQALHFEHHLGFSPAGLTDLSGRRLGRCMCMVQRQGSNRVRGRRTLHSGTALQKVTQNAVGHEKDHHDQDHTHRGFARHRVAARRHEQQNSNEQGAHRRARPVARSAQHTHQHHRQRHRDIESFTRRDIRHKQRMDAAGQTGQRTRQRKRHQLVAKGRNTHDLGDVFVVMNGKQANAQFAGLHLVGNHHGGHSTGQRHQVQRRRGVRADGRHRHCIEVNARAAVNAGVQHNGADHKSDRQREQSKQLTAHRLDPEHHHTQTHTQQSGQQGGGRQSP